MLLLSYVPFDWLHDLSGYRSADYTSMGTTPGTIQWMTQSVTQSVTDSMTQSMTRGMTGPVTEGMTGGITEGMTRGMTRGVTRGVTGGMTRGMTGGVTGRVTGWVLTGMAPRSGMEFMGGQGEGREVALLIYVWKERDLDEAVLTRLRDEVFAVPEPEKQTGIRDFGLCLSPSSLPQLRSCLSLVIRLKLIHAAEQRMQFPVFHPGVLST